MYYLFVILFSVGWILFSIVRNYISKKSPIMWFRKSHFWEEKLLNSKETLKLLVINYGLKTMRGWIKDSCIVINKKMIEKEMGNCGSKSITFLLNNFIVKEQRVNSSLLGKNDPTLLRCTLLGFEINSQVKILSNQINKFRLYFVSHKHSLDKPKINRWFLTGFTDAEGCFLINIYNNSKLRTGWTVHAKFQIELSENDKPLLKKIKVFLGGVGNIYESKGRKSIKFYIQSLKDLAVIIDHFDKYPLITQKLADYKLFIKAVELIQSK